MHQARSSGRSKGKRYGRIPDWLRGCGSEEVEKNLYWQDVRDSKSEDPVLRAAGLKHVKESHDRLKARSKLSAAERP